MFGLVGNLINSLGYIITIAFFLSRARGFKRLIKKEKYKTIAEHLKGSGYFTIGDTINQLAVPKQGFDEITIHNEYTDDLEKIHTEIIEKATKQDKPFLIYLHYSKIHAETTKSVKDKYEGEYDKKYYNNREGNVKNLIAYMQDVRWNRFLQTLTI